MSNYYLGIDVSKGYADFIMINQKKQVVEPNFQLDDTFDGHNKLFMFLDHFCQNYQDATIFAAVESTGGYENNWFHSIHQFQQHFNLKLARLNPKGVNHHSKAGLNRIITDKLSAKNIAEYLRNGGFAFIEAYGFDSPNYPPKGAGALKKMLTEALGAKGKLEPIPNNHILYHSFFDLEDGPPRIEKRIVIPSGQVSEILVCLQPDQLFSGSGRWILPPLFLRPQLQ